MELFFRKDQCCGCGSCAIVCPVSAIKMEADEEGFFYPHIDNNICIDCGLCKKNCAFQSKKKWKSEFATRKIYAAKHFNKKVVAESSSGGAFTAISDFVLNQGGVVCGAAFNVNFEVQHIFTYDKEQRDALRGSKYIQSNIFSVFEKTKKYLSEGYKVLFVGTPCQVDAVKNYLKNRNIDNLILCDIVCHGVASSTIFRDYLCWLEKKYKSSIVEYNFRNKRYAWLGAQAKFKNGKIYYNDAEADVFFAMFLSHYILRPSCGNCEYACTERISDITIADFWGVEKSMPEFYSRDGVSLIITNTLEGQRIFDCIKTDIEYIESSMKNCLQPSLIMSSKHAENRAMFWNDYKIRGFCYVIRKYVYYDIKRQIRSSIKRILRETGLMNIVRQYIQRI